MYWCALLFRIFELDDQLFTACIHIYLFLIITLLYQGILFQLLCAQSPSEYSTFKIPRIFHKITRKC